MCHSRTKDIFPRITAFPGTFDRATSTDLSLGYPPSALSLERSDGRRAICTDSIPRVSNGGSYTRFGLNSPTMGMFSSYRLLPMLHFGLFLLFVVHVGWHCAMPSWYSLLGKIVRYTCTCARLPFWDAAVLHGVTARVHSHWAWGKVTFLSLRFTCLATQ